MPTFVSKDPHHRVGHPAVAKAADSEYFIARFRPEKELGVFRTENKAIADALRALIKDGKLQGVKELPEKGEKPDPNAGQGDGDKAKK